MTRSYVRIKVEEILTVWMSNLQFVGFVCDKLWNHMDLVCRVNRLSGAIM